ncbi:MAG: ROK family transcriptional regulator [Terriglobia bacterium]
MASSEIARDINRSSVLDTIRTGQPLSRADLARQTGLQRSTVSLIVDELIGERWVAEGDLGQLPRGRRPRLLYLNTDRAGIIGINIMPRLTTIALADLSTRFRAQESIPTSRDPSTFIGVLSSCVRGLINQHPDVVYEGIGVSVPGRVDYLAQRLVFAANLGWHQVDLKALLENATGLPVQIENAANACALAEVWSGPHEGMSDLIAVTVSDGIGTGIIANGHLVRGPSGAAGEFGHVCLDPHGVECKCGARGCWEVFASNAAAIRNYSGQKPDGSRKTEEKAGKDPVTSFSDILSLAERGDRRAGDVLDEMARYLGLGIAMLVNGLAPSVIVLVGEVTRAWKRVGPIIQSVVRECAHTHAATRIEPADDATQPRLRGTIALVLQKHFRPRLFD